MDTNFIYTKTAAGEEAIRQRTRVMQRNVRMVLILVDGNSTFQDLCLRTGNVKLTENALLELEKGGFIVPVLTNGGGEGRKSTQASFETTAEKLPSIIPPENTKPPVVSASGVEIITSMQFSITPADYSRPVPTKVPSSALPTQSPTVPVADSQEEYPVLTWSVSDLPPQEMLEERRSQPPSPVFLDRFKSLLQRSKKKEKTVNEKPVSKRPVSEKQVSEKPVKLVPRGGKRSLSWSSLLLFVVILCAALALLLVVFPYDIYLLEIQAALTKNLGRPVRVATVQLAFKPAPTVLLGKVRIDTGGEELSISEVALEPALGSLFSPVKVFRKASLRGMVFPASGVPALASIFETMNRPEAEGRVESLRFEQMGLQLAGIVFPGMEGRLQLSGDGRLLSVGYQTPDRSLKIKLVPAEKQTDVSLEGFAWRPLPDSPLLLDSVSMKGSLVDGVLSLQSLDMRLLEGVLEGTAVLQAGQTVSVVGDLSFARINGSRLEALFGKAAIFQGSISGRMHLAASAGDWAGILPAMQADGDFTVQRGALKGIDLIEAVRRGASGSAVQGGATNFEQLSGKFRLDAKQHVYSSLLMTSGLLHATGNLQTGSDQTVSGAMELQMRGTANQTRVPISVRGPLQAPLAQVGKR